VQISPTGDVGFPRCREIFHPGVVDFLKFRPLFILSDLEPGGAQRVILTILRHMDRKVFEPALVVVRPGGALTGDVPEDIQVHALKSRRVRFSFPSIFRICRAMRPQSLISTLSHLNLYLLSLRFLLPSKMELLVREANTPSMRLRATASPRLYRFLYRRFYPRADRVICNSLYMKEDLVNHFGLSPEKIVVIPNPVDMERIRSACDRGENPYGENRFHLVSVGRLTHQKGFDLLLKSLKGGSREGGDFDLTIVGDGPQQNVLEEMAGELGISERVEFVGHRENPFPYMAHADLFISASRYEGSPNVILESLACGTPVLAFDCPGGTREIIREGKNGWLVPAEDVEAMARKIVQVAKGERRIPVSGDSLLPEEHHCMRVVEKFETLLLETCGRSLVRDHEVSASKSVGA